MKFATYIQEFLCSGFILSANPHEFWLGWGKTQAERSDSRAQGISLYTPDFFLTDPSPWLQYPHFQKVSRTELIELLKPFSETRLSSLNWRAPSYSEFQKTFSELQTLFQSQELKKAVPYVFEEAPISPLSPVTPDQIRFLLRSLLQKTEATPLWIYGFWNSNHGILGATPEVLFSIDAEQTLTTMALAGTKTHASHFNETFLDDPKERTEHQWVVDGIVSSLEKIRPAHASIEVGKLQELVLPHLTHLMTPITVRGMKDTSFEDVVRALHPTPALGAFPREFGWEWLQSYQKKIPRERFGAPFGALLPTGESLCLVAIRNIQWNLELLRLGSGCGIIAASQLDREWNELQAKRNSVKRYFEL